MEKYKVRKKSEQNKKKKKNDPRNLTVPSECPVNFQ